METDFVSRISLLFGEQRGSDSSYKTPIKFLPGHRCRSKSYPGIATLKLLGKQSWMEVDEVVMCQHLSTPGQSS